MIRRTSRNSPGPFSPPSVILKTTKHMYLGHRIGAQLATPVETLFALRLDLVSQLLETMIFSWKRVCRLVQGHVHFARDSECISCLQMQLTHHTPGSSVQLWSCRHTTAFFMEAAITERTRTVAYYRLSLFGNPGDDRVFLRPLKACHESASVRPVTLEPQPVSGIVVTGEEL